MKKWVKQLLIVLTIFAVAGLIILFNKAYFNANSVRSTFGDYKISDSGDSIIDHTKVDAVSGFSQATMDQIGQQKWLFTHASVGANMIGGMNTLHSSNASFYKLVPSVAGNDGIITTINPIVSTTNGTIYDADRSNPGWTSKYSIFNKSIRVSGWNDTKIDAAMDKLCYIDQTANATAYINMMSALENDYPNLALVYATMPLTTGEDSDNRLRNDYNNVVRSYCSINNKILFDIADIEAHNQSGWESNFSYSGQSYQKLYSSYSSDGGHLNSAGAQRVALGWYATANLLTNLSEISETERLIPGEGWNGNITQPDSIGNPLNLGYDEKAIARWDVVPYQTFNDTFNVGVLAFHIAGIANVSFSVNNGSWSTVYNMTENPQTGINEYWTTINASYFADGLIEIRAIAHPNFGVPRVLQGNSSSGDQSLFLNTNYNGSLPNLIRYVSMTGNDVTGIGNEASPFASIRHAVRNISNAQGSVDGGIVYLLAGSYTIQSSEGYDNFLSTNRWLTITAAPGINRAEVVISGSSPNGLGWTDGLTTKLQKISNVNLTGIVVGSSRLYNVGDITATWYDGVEMIGPGRDIGVSFREYQSNRRYMTDVYVHDMQDVPDGINIQRNLRVERIAQSGFHNTLLLVNSTLSDSNRGGNNDLHPDVYQFTYDVSNAILYGVYATEDIYSFCIRMQPSATDVAIIQYNCTLQSGIAFELERPYRNILLKDSRFESQGAYFPYENTLPQTFSAKNVVFDNVTGTEEMDPFEGVLFMNLAGPSCMEEFYCGGDCTLCSIPTIPAGLGASAISSSQIDLNWTDSINETAYIIERSLTSESGFSQIAIAEANSVNYSDNSELNSGTTYYYKIASASFAGNSSFSLVASATTSAVTTPVDDGDGGSSGGGGGGGGGAIPVKNSTNSTVNNNLTSSNISLGNEENNPEKNISATEEEKDNMNGTSNKVVKLISIIAGLVVIIGAIWFGVYKLFSGSRQIIKG